MEKRVDIKTGFICNNNCRFCVQADNKCKGNRSFEEIKKDLEETRERCSGVVLTGGEVTIRKDFLDIVRLAKDLGYKTIQIQTNARMFASLDFCKKTIKAGATEFSPALHGYCKEQHDFLTRAPGSFSQTTKAIKSLKSLGAYVLTNTVVVKPNYRNLPDIAKLLVKLDVDQFQFAFVHPMGNAWKNFDSIVPCISLAAPYIHEGLQIGIDAGKMVMAEAMPYCLMKGYEDYVAEKVIPETEIRGAKHQNTDSFTKQRQVYGKAKFSQCKECRYNVVCEGPWREYPEKKGNGEFKAVNKNRPEINESLGLINEYLGVIEFKNKKQVIWIDKMLSQENLLPLKKRLEFSFAFKGDEESILRIVWYGLFKEKDNEKIARIIKLFYDENTLKKIKEVFSICDKNLKLAFGLDWSNPDDKPRLKVYFYVLETDLKWKMGKLSQIFKVLDVDFKEKVEAVASIANLAFFCIDIKNTGELDLKLYIGHDTDSTEISLLASNLLGITLADKIRLPYQKNINLRVFECYKFSANNDIARTLYVPTTEIAQKLQNVVRISDVCRIKMSKNSKKAVNCLLSKDFLPNYVSIGLDGKKFKRNIYFTKI